MKCLVSSHSQGFYAAAAPLDLPGKAAEAFSAAEGRRLRSQHMSTARQQQFSAVDSFTRLEISEFVELRKLSAGEARALRWEVFFMSDAVFMSLHDVLKLW